MEILKDGRIRGQTNKSAGDHLGILRRKSYIKKGYNHSEETRQRLRDNHADVSGKKHPNWKGGISKTKEGYIRIMLPAHLYCDNHGYVLEHRLVIEKQIGRYLHKFEIVHHVNKIINDNRPENLMAFISNGIHLKFEANKLVNENEIIFDGRKKEALK